MENLDLHPTDGHDCAPLLCMNVQDFIEGVIGLLWTCKGMQGHFGSLQAHKLYLSWVSLKAIQPILCEEIY